MNNDILHPAFTTHGIEEFPEISDLPPQDQAMDSFRSNFSLVVRQIDISKDGRVMTYKLRGTKLMENYLSMARTVIILQRLPLKVSRDKFEINGVVFEDNMVLTFLDNE
jgi:hypothetical protein